LVFGDLVEEVIEGRAVEDPVEGDSGHDRGRGVFDERIEDRGQDQGGLLGRGSYPV
jgi:hypothetical protein